MMSNMVLRVSGVSEESLVLALKLRGREKVFGYSFTSKDLGADMVLHWTNHDGVQPFPAVLTLEQVAPIIMQWLKSVQYPNEPMHDGDNTRGWLVYCQDWGQIERDWSSFLAIAPFWAIYAK